MRTTTLTCGLLLAATAIAIAACGGGENAGAEEARREAAAEAARKKAAEPKQTGPKVTPPVPGRAKLQCSQVIDDAKFTTALGEATPIVVTASKSEPETAASCSLIRGGKRPSEAEQKAILKTKGRLGVLAGDEVCNVSVFCWTIEDPDRFMAKCKQDKDQDDSSLGFRACVHIVPTGEDDVKRFRFFDDDTRCIIQVRGGPSNVDNDLIGKCAKTAHDLIGPQQIAVHP
jgi:hypothetical protein